MGDIVGSASVVIEADLAQFGRESAEGIKDAAKKIGPTVESSLKQAGDDAAGKAGKATGEKFGDAAAGGVKATSGKVSDAADKAATHAGKEAESRFGEYGKKAGEKFSENAKEGLGGLKGAAFGAVGALGTGELVKSSLEAADQLEGANLKIEHVFGESGEQVHAWAVGLAKTFGISTAAGEQMAGTFAQMLSPLKLSKEETAKMSEKLTTLTQDVAKYNNADPAKVQAALQRGLKGSGAALRQFGIDVSNTAVKQYALNHGMTNSIVSASAVKAAHEKVAIATLNLESVMRKANSTSLQRAKAQAALETANLALNKAEAGKIAPLTSAQKAEASYALILQQTKKQQGAVADSSETFAQKQKDLSAQVENLKAGLGLALMPALAKVAGFLLDTVVPAILTFGHWLKQNADWLVPLVGAIGAAVVVWKLFTLAQAALNLVMEANPFVLLATLIAALVAGIVIAWKHSETFRDIIKGVFSVITSVFHTVWGFIKKWGIDVGLFIMGPVGWLIILWRHSETFRDIVKGAFHVVADAALWLWHNVMEPVAKGIGAAFRWISDRAHEAWRGVKQVYQWIKSGIHAVSDVVSTVAGAVGGFFTKIGDVMKSVYDHTIGPVIDKITSAIKTISGWLGSGPKNGMQNLQNLNPGAFTGLGHAGPVPQAAPHALGGPLGDLNVVGEQGKELVLGGRQVVSNPSTRGGNFDVFANRIADKLNAAAAHNGRPTIGEVHLHYPKPDTIDRGLATAMRNAQAMLG